MADLLNDNGLTVKTANEIREDLVNGFKEVYGSDINLDSNTQDGQIIDIFTQINTDMRELAMGVYNSMNPDLVRGKLQDVRFRINNLFRKQGSFTEIPITLKLTETVTLNGLDANYYDIDASAYGFTDDSGNVYYLIDTVTLEPGEHIKLFRAKEQGDINPAIRTVVNPLTIIKGVQSGSNESGAVTIGTIEETDEEFAERRQHSLEISAQNSCDALQSQLLDIDGVTQAFVYEHDYVNYPTGIDEDGIPLHYIWVIVEGGANSDIAETIYKNTCGVGTIGDIDIEILSASKQMKTYKFDRVVSTPLYIKFTLKQTETGLVYDYDAIKDYIANNLTYDVNEFAETSKITQICAEAINVNGGCAVPVNVQISLNNTEWVNYIASTSKKHKFTVDSTRITIEV